MLEDGGDGLSWGVNSAVGGGNVGDISVRVSVGTLRPTVPPGTWVVVVDSVSQKYMRYNQALIITRKSTENITSIKIKRFLFLGTETITLSSGI